MPPQAPSDSPALNGRVVVITRPAGHGAALQRAVRRLGGQPLLLPGLALRGWDDAATRGALAAALADDYVIFTSPAAVRHAAALGSLQSAATVLAVGAGTRRALRRHGVAAPLAPQRQDSEGLLAHPALREVRGRRVALIGAPGGRGLLSEGLLARGARLRPVHVYRRVLPRLDRRHVTALLALPAAALVLLSSAEALRNLHALLPALAWDRLRTAVAVVSSERLAAVAREAGFRGVLVADSAVSADLLDAAARAAK